MSDEERKRLVWNIKKKYTGELFQLTKDIHPAPDTDVTPLKDGDEESNINYIVTYMHSCELSRLPDQGIMVLMNLNECIDEIVEKRARTEKVTQPSIAFHRQQRGPWKQPLSFTTKITAYSLPTAWDL